MKTIFSLFLFLLFFSFLTAQNISIELFKNGFNNPIDLQNAGDDRLFVVEKGGRIKILNPDTTVNTELFLNITSQVSTGGEQGLLGLAFHPDYATNGYFYVNYTKPNGDTQISRFTVDPIDPNIADPTSELPIIGYAQPFSNHNGGGIAFGLDGYLYIAAGDGGSGGDPGNRAQNTTLLLGKLLRIDVDNPSGGNNYGIPADNPFEGSIVDAEEIWAYGLRNPWRFSFDSENGDLWIGDVGQGSIEEINKVAVTAGGLNYGWRCYEGSQPYNTTGCPPMEDLTFPIAEYTHDGGNCSITGGYVYHGIYTNIQGLYFFADYCSGMIGTVDASGTLVNHGTFGGNWVSFGLDFNNELYIVNISGGSIYKINGEIIAGVTDFDNQNLLVMTPNPASEYVSLSIENDQIYTVAIMDIKGSLLITEDNLSVSEKNIRISSLSSGLYLVKVISVSGKSIVKKLVIE
jgi:hypothetical protein